MAYVYDELFGAKSLDMTVKKRRQATFAEVARSQ